MDQAAESEWLIIIAIVVHIAQREETSACCSTSGKLKTTRSGMSKTFRQAAMGFASQLGHDALSALACDRQQRRDRAVRDVATSPCVDDAYALQRALHRARLEYGMRSILVGFGLMVLIASAVGCGSEKR